MYIVAPIFSLFHPFFVLVPLKYICNNPKATLIFAIQIYEKWI